MGIERSGATGCGGASIEELETGARAADDGKTSELITAALLEGNAADGVSLFGVPAEDRPKVGWLLPYGRPLYVGGGAHLPSGPAGLPATGTYCPSQARTATVTHHGMLLGIMVGSGAVVTCGGATAADTLGAFFEHAFEEAEDLMKDDGWIVIVMVVLTCSVL
jgi:hypothetical protein